MGQGDGMEIVCIGAGNLATRLCVALQQCGHRVVQVFSRTEECAAALAAQLGCEPVCRLEDVTPEAPLYILSVRDQVLEEVAHGLYASLLRRVAPGGSNVGAGALFVHTAGSMPLDVLPMLRRGVFYPMQTFSKQREVPFAGLPVFIESPTDAAVLRTLAASMGCGVYEMDSASRRYLHLAAVFACNFSNHIGRCRCNQYNIRLFGQCYVFHTILKITIKGINQALVPGQCFEGNGIDKVGSIFCHQHCNVSMHFFQHTCQICYFVCSNTAGYC